MTETTTIQVKLTTKAAIDSLKLCPDESYNSALTRILQKGKQ